MWFVPDVRVFVDNRQDPYPADVLQAGFDAESESRYPRAFDKYDVRCAYVLTSSDLAKTLRSRGWKRTYSGSDREVLVAP